MIDVDNTDLDDNIDTVQGGIRELVTENLVEKISPFMHQIPLVLIAMLGGSLLAIGNITMQWSTTVFYAPLTTVLALQGSMCVLLGTYLNYLLEPEKTGKPSWLMYGVLTFVCAIGLSTIAQRLYVIEKGEKEAEKEEKSMKPFLYIGDNDVSTASDQNDEQQSAQTPLFISSKHSTIIPHNLPSQSLQRSGSYGSNESFEVEIDPIGEQNKVCCNETFPNDPNISNGTNQGLHHTSTRLSHLSPKDTAFFGIAVAFVGGLCLGFFSPALNIAVNDPFSWSSTSNTEGGLLVTVANSWFAIAFALSSIIWNIFLMRYPPSTTSVAESCIQLYIGEPWRDRQLAFFSGVVCALGNALQFQGGSLAGFAAADMVQAFPLVATMWDFIIFEEFSCASKRVYFILVFMYVTYICGICLLTGSIAV